MTMTSMKSLSSPSVVLVVAGREFSSSRCRTSIMPSRIPDSRPLCCFNTRSSSSRTSSCVAINSDQVSTVVAASDPELTWQILVGALAGVIPFVVAAIEFSKRILAQKKCGLCQGSGLVLLKDNNNYIRCPDCGGFLPWQSWKRFFSG